MRTNRFQVLCLAIAVLGAGEALSEAASGDLPLKADFQVPMNAEIALISNSPQGLTSMDEECHVPVGSDRIRAFFSGECKILDPMRLGFGENLAFVEQYLDHNWELTLPADLPAAIMAGVKVRESDAFYVLKGKRWLGFALQIEGALVTNKGQIYFWRLYSDSILLLWTSEKDERFLVKQKGDNAAYGR
jgi:hypothetical protein